MIKVLHLTKFAIYYIIYVTNRKERGNKMKISKEKLITIATFAALVAIAVFIAFSISGDLKRSAFGYEDLKYGDFTVKKVSRSETDAGTAYRISVNETDRILYISNAITERESRARLDALQEGDDVYCYYIESSGKLEAVEIGQAEPIISIDSYRQAYKRQAISGFAVIAFISLLSVGFVIYYCIKEKRSE